MRKMTVMKGDRAIILDVYGLSHGLNHLWMINAVGSRSQVEGAAAMIRSRSAFAVSTGSRTVHGYDENLGPDVNGTEFPGYYTYMHHLDLDTWQLLAITKNPEYIKRFDAEHLWQYLRSDAHTTPIQRAWMPYLMHKLRSIEFARIGSGFGFEDQGGLIRVKPEELDEIVSAGLRSRKICIVNERETDDKS